jgi:Cu/Ag efflux protein CusF
MKNMKTNRSTYQTAVCAAVLMLTMALKASANQAATAAKPEKTYTGTVKAVDPKEHTLDVKGFTLSKKFNLGDNCAYVLWNKPAGAISDLRPGEKVTVAYQDAHGVLVADRVEQQPMQNEGMVKAIDPTAHLLTLRNHGIDKTFLIAKDCDVELRDGKSGPLTDIQIGNHVTVTYETPTSDKPTARQIAQTSIEFTGSLTAVDLTEQTVKAKAPFGSKTFRVADNCAVVINGKTDGKLSGLKLGDKLEFSYDDVNGVNIVNRIGAAPPQKIETTSVQPMVP